MTTINCDLCGSILKVHVIRVEVWTSQAPTRQNDLRKTIDACVFCASKVDDLKSELHLEDLKKRVR